MNPTYIIAFIMILTASCQLYMAPPQDDWTDTGVGCTLDCLDPDEEGEPIADMEE